MFLIIDAGSTKTEWVVTSDALDLFHFYSSGLNPNYHADDLISENFSSFVAACPLSLLDKLHCVRYYGSGCARDASASRIKTLLSHFFPQCEIAVASDLMGACVAVCDKQPGLVAILGTGAAACLYDGNSIVDMAPSLGFMLGDEGSGTNLGKRFLTQYLLHHLPTHIKHDFEQSFAVNESLVLQKIYREPAPNKFMASLAPFIKSYLSDDYIYSFCHSAFTDFFDQQICYFSDYKKLKLNIVGSVGFHFEEIIREVAKEKYSEVGTVCAAPMPLLIKQTKNS